MDPALLPRGEAGRLVEAARRNAKTWTERRDAALVSVLYFGGLRCSEALGLDRCDLERVEGGGLKIRVRIVKGRKRGTPPRFVALSPERSVALSDYCTAASSVAAGLLPVFLTGSGRRLSASHVRRTVSRLGLRHLDSRVHPHALRHAFARELHDEGFSPVEIMLSLGHARLDTTQGYLRSIGADEIVERLLHRGATT